MPSEAKSKLTIVCQWFLAKGCTDIEKIALLTYLSDREHLRRYGRSINRELCRRSGHEILYSLNVGNFKLENRVFGEDELSDTEREVLNLLWNLFGALDVAQLGDIISSFPEFHGAISLESVLIGRWLVDYPEESKRKMRLHNVKLDLLELSEAHLKAVRRYLVDIFALPL